jgi:hypothetical protein
VIYRVEIGAAVLDEANRRFGESRSALGQPSEYDFVAGPLAAAAFAFRDFEALAFDLVEAVRYYTVVDPFFGPVTFVGLLRNDAVVEIVQFADDPDYWSQFEEGVD